MIALLYSSRLFSSMPKMHNIIPCFDSCVQFFLWLTRLPLPMVESVKNERQNLRIFSILGVGERHFACYTFINTYVLPDVSFSGGSEISFKICM